MEFAMASAIGVLTASGVYLLLRARTFDVILGLTLLSYATNLLIFSSGRLVAGKPPVLREGVAAIPANYADPLPQALVLTAIVIAFAMTAIVVVVAMRQHADLRSDHVDGPKPRPARDGVGNGRDRDPATVAAADARPVDAAAEGAEAPP